MNRREQLEQLDRELVDELARVARETVRDELREQTRKRRRRAAFYAASGAVALYAGAALALAVGLALAGVVPGWAAALITAVLLGVVAQVLRGAARPSEQRSFEGGAEGRSAGHRHTVGGDAPAAPPSGMGLPYPPTPSAPPMVQGGATGVPGAPRMEPSQDELDPEARRNGR
ncbi:phage holin family protein [Streptomyces sp. NPDC052077]|uniref:phage holin family protein n=1 Tax=Streptomyces sp. NPDC052077 TaxID=3154757 RepID=UPI00341FDA5A